MLTDIESYIAERPDSALTVLESVNPDVLKRKRDRAKHALLYAMALDKNYIDVSDDSLARVAVDYYSEHGPEKYKARSLYYLGLAYYYQKDYTKAILEFTRSEKSASISDSLYWGMALLAQADTYSHTYNDTERIKSLQESLQIFDGIGKIDFSNIVKFRLAQTYANMKKYDKADSLYRAVLDEENLKESLKIDIISSYAFMKMADNNPDYQEALKLYEILENQYGFRSMTYNDYWSWAYALSLAGNDSKSASLVRQLSVVDTSLNASYWKYRMARNNNDYDNAFVHLRKYNSQQNELVDTLLKQSLASAQRDYFRTQSQVSEYRLTIRTMWFLVIASLTLVIVTLVTISVRHKIKQIQKEKERILEYIDEINRQFNISGLADSRSLKSKFISLYKSRFDTLSLLCNQYFAHDGYEGAEKLMYKKVWSLIEDIRNDKVRRENFEKLLDTELDGIMSNIRMEMPKLKEVDYTMFSYIIAGFDLTAISRLLGMSLNNVYAHKRRIRIKIEEKQPLHASQYLEMMS